MNGKKNKKKKGKKAAALADDEALINPHFMQQLLRYGLQMGLAGNHMDADQLAADAQRLVAELKAVQAASE